jgi:hypothetical protein
MTAPDDADLLLTWLNADLCYIGSEKIPAGETRTVMPLGACQLTLRMKING